MSAIYNMLVKSGSLNFFESPAVKMEVIATKCLSYAS